MKTISFLTLLVLLISTSAFNTNDELENLNNGTYTAFFSKSVVNNQNPNGKNSRYDQKVDVKVENNSIKYISPLRKGNNCDNLLGIQFKEDETGNFIATNSSFEQVGSNKNSNTLLYEYRLIIYKKDIK